MGWEKRGRHLYYYRKRREGGRVISEYVGTGELALVTSAVIEDQQELSRTERGLAKADQADELALAAEVDALGAQVRALVAAVLVPAGYHQHHGTWRRRRGRNDAGGDDPGARAGGQDGKGDQ